MKNHDQKSKTGRLVFEGNLFWIYEPVRRQPLYQFEDRWENSGSARVGQSGTKKNTPRKRGCGGI